jgi:hypothetical protein
LFITQDNTKTQAASQETPVAMVTDVQLGNFVNALGVLIMLLIVLYHVLGARNDAAPDLVRPSEAQTGKAVIQ